MKLSGLQAECGNGTYITNAFRSTVTVRASCHHSISTTVQSVVNILIITVVILLIIVIMIIKPYSSAKMQC